MANSTLYSKNQKQPNVKQKSTPKAPHQKTPRVKLHPVGFSTSEGDRGIKRIEPQSIPRQTRAPSATGDSIRSHVGKVGSAMKKMGMLV